MEGKGNHPKRDDKCYMARSREISCEVCGDTWERKYTTWVGALQSLIYNIGSEEFQKREDKRADRLKEREQNTPPLPKGLEDWAKKQASEQNTSCTTSVMEDMRI